MALRVAPTRLRWSGSALWRAVSTRTRSAAEERPRQDAKVLVPGAISRGVEQMDYAVRGELVLRAQDIQDDLRAGATHYPFREIVYCNIGNPHNVGQTPITFLRQVLAGCLYPPAAQGMPEDVQARVKRILADTAGGGVGAYSESKGLRSVRQSVMRFIEERDGLSPGDVNFQHLFLTNGASEGVKAILSMLIRSTSDGVLIPIPQYPLYSASITMLGGSQVPYYLDETKHWSTSVAALQQALDGARSRGVEPRALAIINPGNPTGQVLSRSTMEEVVAFCQDNKLVLMADEVYQSNVYQPDSFPFTSFRKVVLDMGVDQELVSFHSISKGMLGECGLRGGYMDLINIVPDTIDQLYKFLSVNLCSSVPGQVAIDVMVNPPKDGDPSYELYRHEMNSVFQSLQRKAMKVSEALNSLEGVSCNVSSGAMYSFPSVTLPPAAVREASRRGKAADTFYALEMLEKTGVCVVPGSGFGQASGTWHFRTTFLPPEDKVDEVVERIRDFHDDFLRKYAGVG